MFDTWAITSVAPDDEIVSLLAVSWRLQIDPDAPMAMTAGAQIGAASVLVQQLDVRGELVIRSVRVHDLKHTDGRRLRAAGVSFEDRQDLLGHKSTRITTHYSAAEIANLIAASEKAL